MPAAAIMHEYSLNWRDTVETNTNKVSGKIFECSVVFLLFLPDAEAITSTHRDHRDSNISWPR